MNEASLLRHIQQLTAPPTAPYQEAHARGALHQWLLQLGFKPRRDSFGNTWVQLRRGRPKAALAMAAHLDHPALQVETVRGRQVRCSALGGLPTRGIRGALVSFPYTAHGSLTGTIVSARVIKSGGRERLNSAVIRLGQAQAPAPGDVGVFALPSFRRRGNRLSLRCADDILGCAAMVAALSDLQAGPGDVDVTALFTRAEEVGLHGALAIAQEGTLPADTLFVSVECSRAIAPIVLGGGPVVRLGDRAGPFTPAACATLRAAAYSLGDDFKFQTGWMPGGTCEATAFLAFGYACTGVALPLANYHNQGEHGVAPEQIDLRDLQGACRLLTAMSLRVATGVDDMGRLRDDMLLSSRAGMHKLRTTEAVPKSHVP